MILLEGHIAVFYLRLWPFVGVKKDLNLVERKLRTPYLF